MTVRVITTTPNDHPAQGDVTTTINGDLIMVTTAVAEEVIHDRIRDMIPAEIIEIIETGNLGKLGTQESVSATLENEEINGTRGTERLRTASTSLRTHRTTGRAERTVAATIRRADREEATQETTGETTTEATIVIDRIMDLITSKTIE